MWCVLGLILEHPCIDFHIRERSIPVSFLHCCCLLWSVQYAWICVSNNFWYWRMLKFLRSDHQWSTYEVYDQYTYIVINRDIVTRILIIQIWCVRCSPSHCHASSIFMWKFLKSKYIDLIHIQYAFLFSQLVRKTIIFPQTHNVWWIFRSFQNIFWVMYDMAKHIASKISSYVELAHITEVV